MDPTRSLPYPNGLPSQATVSRGVNTCINGDASGALAAHRSRLRPAKGSKSSCEASIHPDTGGLQMCACVVARLFDNRLCKRHCEVRGGCHPPEFGTNLEQAVDMLNLGRGNEMRMPPDEQATYNQYPLDNISPSDTVLLMPPRTAEHLDAQERKDLNSALARSLEPTPSISYQYPYNSYVSALGVMCSNTPIQLDTIN
jgi:hypothetical protein